MTREEEIKNIALCYAHDELKDNHSVVEDVVVAAFMDGANYADAHPHWISVEDEMPPRFVLDPNDSLFVLTYGFRTIVAFYKYDKGEWVGNTEVTHWMPLPQMPVLSNSGKTGKDLKGGEE